jgi:hypothetical protein
LPRKFNKTKKSHRYTIKTRVLKDKVKLQGSN